MMLSLILACAVCAPIVVAYHFITRVPALAFLVLFLNLGLGVFAGYMFCWFSNRKGRIVANSRLVAGSVVVGILVTTTQYSVAYEFGGLAFWGPLWGAILGGVGTAVYLALERAMKRREDPKREERFRRAIDEHAESNQDDD